MSVRLFPWVILTLVAGSVQAANPTLTIATGPVAGFVFPLGGEICRVFDQGNGGNHCAVYPSSGSVENLERLRGGDVDLALVQSDRATEAMTANGPFAGKPPFSELRSVVGFYSDALAIIVRTTDPVQSIDDLKGKRIIAGEPGAPDLLFNDWRDSLGWSKADLGGVVEMKRADQIAALCGAKVAAIAVTAAHPNRFVRDALAACPTALLDLAGAGLDGVVNSHPAYAPAVIDPSVYGKTGAPTQSFGPRTVLVAKAALPDETVTRLLSSLFGRIGELRAAHPAFSGLDQRALAAGAGLGPERHPSALKYLTNKKLIEVPGGD